LELSSVNDILIPTRLEESRAVLAQECWAFQLWLPSRAVVASATRTQSIDKDHKIAVNHIYTPLPIHKKINN